LTKKQIYLTAQNFRIALEDRLNKLSKKEGLDLMRLRRHVAFDRFLSRLFFKESNDVVLKGGYALELWLENVRATRDIDISLHKDGNLSGPVMIQDFLQNQSLLDNGDFFKFYIGKASLDLENAPYGGYRFPIEARLAGRLFIKFDIDAAIGDVWLKPHEKVIGKDWLGFAGIKSPVIPVISKEQQFAEKIHAYTLPRKIPNSRVKDLVDLFFLIEKSNLNKNYLLNAMKKTFKHRSTHILPARLPDPPDNWVLPFENMAQIAGVSTRIQKAMEKIQKFYGGLNLHKEDKL